MDSTDNQVPPKTDQELYPLLDSINKQQAEQTKLLGKISFAVQLVAVIVLLAVVLAGCNALLSI